MSKIKPIKIIQYFIINIVLLNICGCATTMLWQIDQGTRKEISHENEAVSTGLYLPCDKNLDSTYIQYKLTDIPANSELEFPPFEEGFVVISNNYITRRMLTDLKRKKYYTISGAELGKIDILNSKDTPRYFHLFFIADKYGNQKDFYGSRYLISQPEHLELSFVKKDEVTSSVICEQLNNKPFNFDIKFSQGSKLDDKRKFNPIIVVIGTPFSVALDILTSPIQLLFLLYLISHASPA